MLLQMLGFFIYFFYNPSILGIGLALAFGAIWLACYRPPMISRPWLWVVLVAGGVAAPIAIAITAYPVRFALTQVYGHFWSPQTLAQWSLLASIPSMYIFGLVREGAKLLPVAVYWWRKGRNIDLKLGLMAGAVAGAGYGILEAQWTLNYMIASGWSWDKVEIEGLVALGGFWESFFIVALHVGTTALAGWGLAKGWGWQFYLLAAFLYMFPNYSSVLVASKLISAVQAEFLIAAWALLVTGVALWFREREVKDKTK